LSYGGKNGGSWMESNLVPGRDLVYSQTSGHRSLFAQPIDWYPMSGLNRLQQVCRTRHRPNGSGKYMLHARYLHRAPLGYTYPCGSGHVVQEPALGSVLAPPTRFELVAHRIDSPVPPQV